jgi:hypothetical protein
MKYLTTALASIAMCGSASAQAVFSEFSVGAAFPSRVETAQYDVLVPFDVSVDYSLPTPGTLDLDAGDLLSGTLSGDYNPGIAAGLEIGLRGVGDKHISLSISYDYAQANLEDVTASGTITRVGTATAAPLTFGESAAALRGAGVEFNNEAHLLLGHIRYDFVGPREPIQPFIAVGGGGSFIENSESSAALAGTAGVRVPLGLGFYAGAKYRYVRVFGYEDQLGIDYDEMSGHVVSLMLGAQM